MAAQQQQQPQGDNSLAPFWILIGLFVLCSIIWLMWHTQIAHFLLKIRYAEASLITFFVPSAESLKLTISQLSMSPENITFKQVGAISAIVGDYFRIPVAVILVLLAATIYFRNPLLRYKKVYNMQMLVDEEKHNWPQIIPVAKLDLVNTDIDKGPWAMAMSPMQFAKKYNLLREEKFIPTDPNVLQQSKIIAVVKRPETHQVFAMQLGRYWTGIEHLNPHTKAVFAALAARAARDADVSRDYLMKVAASTETGKLDFSGADELIQKYKDYKPIAEVTQKHGFVLTVMASMLQLARTDGVQATADFVWLKPVDRYLWFMLNSVGRQTAFAEVSGPFAHWLAEKNMGRKLSVPMVEEAVNALEAAIKDIIYKPDEKEQ